LCILLCVEDDVYICFLGNILDYAMESTEREREIAVRYLQGEYTEVQMNYLAHQCGSDRERMDRILEKISTEMPLATAAKFILLCMVLHFLACTAYSLVVL
jgi:sensor histidine kinase regulating citrate/malate metabolism